MICRLAGQLRSCKRRPRYLESRRRPERVRHHRNALQTRESVSEGLLPKNHGGVAAARSFEHHDFGGHCRQSISYSIKQASTRQPLYCLSIHRYIMHSNQTPRDNHGHLSEFAMSQVRIFPSRLCSRWAVPIWLTLTIVWTPGRAVAHQIDGPPVMMLSAELEDTEQKSDAGKPIDACTWVREIFRQHVLMVAREEFGFVMRDVTLGEPVDHNSVVCRDR